MLRTLTAVAICVLSMPALSADKFASCRTHEWTDGGDRFTAEMAQRLIARDGNADAVLKGFQAGHKAELKVQATLSGGDKSLTEQNTARLKNEHTKFIAALTPLLQCVEQRLR